MKAIISTAGCAVALLFAGMANAKTTTTTTLTGPAKATPGSTITLQAVVTGRHIAYGGGGSALGGNVQLSDQTGIVASAMSTALNTPIVDEEVAYCNTDYTCVIPIFLGDVTTINFAYTLPHTVGIAHFNARYTGENWAKDSISPPISVVVKSPDISPVIDYLLQD